MEIDRSAIPARLAVINQHPKGNELQVVLSDGYHQELPSIQDSFLKQVEFASRYSALLSRRGIFRLTFLDLAADKMTANELHEFMKRLPRAVSTSGVRCLQVVWSIEGSRNSEFGSAAMECHTACASERLIFRPGFSIDPLHADWREIVHRCLDAGAEIGRVACRVETPGRWLESFQLDDFFRGAGLTIAEMSRCLKVDLELQMCPRIPPMRDDLWVLMARSILSLMGIPAMIQVLAEVDPLAPAGPRRRKTSLINEICYDTLVEFNRTQDYGALRNLLQIVAAMEEADS